MLFDALHRVRKLDDVAAEPVRGFSAAVCVVRVLIFLLPIMGSSWGPRRWDPSSLRRGARKGKNGLFRHGKITISRPTPVFSKSAINLANGDMTAAVFGEPLRHP